MAGDLVINVPKIEIKSELESSVAKVAERALNETWTGTADVFSDVFGGLVGDSIKQWRFRRFIETLTKTRDHLESKGINIERAKSLPMGEALAIFDGASRTEDVDLQNMWAALLSNGMNPDKEFFIDPSFTRLLGELSGLDARILNYMLSFETSYDKFQMERRALWRNFDPIANKDTPELKEKQQAQQNLAAQFRDEAESLRNEISAQHSDEHISYAIGNLSRLGLIEIPFKKKAGRSSLIQIHLDRRNEQITTSTVGLEAELQDLRHRQSLGFANDKSLPKMTQKAHLMEEFHVPVFALTDYAKRFLQACR